MEQKSINSQLFALPTQNIKQEVSEIELKDVPNQLSAASSSINTKHEIDPASSECELGKDSNDIPDINIESTCITTDHMCYPFLHDTKDHLKVDSINEDDNSHNVLKSGHIVSSKSTVTEPTTSGFGHVKTEKYHDDDVGPNTGFQTKSDTAGDSAPSVLSNTKEERDMSEINNILPGHLEAKLVESAGSTLLGEDGNHKTNVNFKHSNKKTYNCDLCQKTFSKWSKMGRHKLTHTKQKPFQCDICQKSFSQSGSVLRHKLTHTKEKPFQCDICEKSFSTNGNLNTHRQSVHRNVRPYQCDICQKSFSLQQHMMQHKLTHTKEKPYECDFCQKSFTRNTDLLRHKLTHTNVKPFRCDICQKAFTRNSSLKQHHQSVHCDIDTKLFLCDICNIAFPSNTDLLRHNLTHTKEKQASQVCTQ